MLGGEHLTWRQDSDQDRKFGVGTGTLGCVRSGKTGGIGGEEELSNSFLPRADSLVDRKELIKPTKIDREPWKTINELPSNEFHIPTLC